MKDWPINRTHCSRCGFVYEDGATTCDDPAADGAGSLGVCGGIVVPGSPTSASLAWLGSSGTPTKQARELNRLFDRIVEATAIARMSGSFNDAVFKLGLTVILSEEIPLGSPETPQEDAAPPVMFSERKMFTPRDLDAQTKPLHAEIERLKAAVLWALGENGTFSEEPAPLAGKWRQRFWWRGELRERAFGATQPPSLLAASEGRFVESVAALIEVEERACRQKEHDAKSRHARACWGASAATCGVLAAQVRKLAPLAEPPA